MKRLTVLGATGSVGRRALELIERFPGQFRVEGLAARGTNPDLVAELCRTHRPRVVALADESAVDVLARALGHPRPEILGGARGLVTLAFVRPDRAGAAFAIVVLGLLAASLDRGAVGPARWQRVAVTLLGVCYVNWLLGHAISLRALPDGVHWVLLLVWVTCIGETAAYTVGSLLGRHKLAPGISPGKTVEGATAQLAASLLAALTAGGWLFPGLRLRDALAVGVLLGVLGQVGDLVESALKRSVGTKDTGHIIPGHGGILDRIDGFLFNAPVLFYYVTYGRAWSA